jgi:hypothetical protein
MRRLASFKARSLSSQGRDVNLFLIVDSFISFIICSALPGVLFKITTSGTLAKIKAWIIPRDAPPAPNITTFPRPKLKSGYLFLILS